MLQVTPPIDSPGKGTFIQPGTAYMLAFVRQHQPPVGLSIEHCTSIAEVIGLHPVQVYIIFQASRKKRALSQGGEGGYLFQILDDRRGT